MNGAPPPKRSPSGLFEAVSLDPVAATAVSGIRPMEAPTHSLPPPPSTERLVARIGAALTALSGPSQMGLEGACVVLEAALSDLLPERRVRVLPVGGSHDPAVQFAHDPGGGSEDANVREFLVPDVIAPVARVVLESRGPSPFDEHAIERDRTVLRGGRGGTLSLARANGGATVALAPAAYPFAA